MIDSYDKLTVGKWLELKNVNLEQDDIDIQADILSVLTDKTVDELMLLPIPEYQSLVQTSTFLNTEPKTLTKLPETLKLEDKEFYIHQKVEKMTAGQYIDYQSYLKDNDYAHILPCFIIPKGKKYGEDYDIEEVSQIICNNLPITVALTISRFFFLQYLSLTQATVDYLISKTKKIARKTKNKEMLKALKRL